MFVVLFTLAAGSDAVTHLQAPVFRRSATSTRIAPAPETQLNYDSATQYGRGYNHRTEQYLAHAFEPYTANITQLPVTLATVFTRKVLTSTSEFNSAMRATANVEASGWGVKAKAEASFERGVRMHRKDALFVLHGSKEMGFEGWSFEDVPKFTELAKASLCDNGTFTPDKFEKVYGTYYVRGKKKATTLDVFVRVETKTSSSSSKISASMEASWSGYGASVGGGASFSNQLSGEQSESRVNIEARAYGTAKNWMPAVNAENLDDVVNEWKVMDVGAGIAFQLTRYDDHDDYIQIRERCRARFEDMKRDEYWMDRYADVAVEAKLFAEEIMLTNENYAVAQEAFKLYDEILSTGEDQFNADGYMEARRKMDAVYDQLPENCILADVVPGVPGKLHFRYRDPATSSPSDAVLFQYRKDGDWIDFSAARFVDGFWQSSKWTKGNPGYQHRIKVGGTTVYNWASENDLPYDSCGHNCVCTNGSLGASKSCSADGAQNCGSCDKNYVLVGNVCKYYRDWIEKEFNDCTCMPIMNAKNPFASSLEEQEEKEGRRRSSPVGLASPNSLSASEAEIPYVDVTGEKSGSYDDAQSRAYCPTGTVISGCECFSQNACDGALGEGNSCVAYNSNGSKGVWAKARCLKVEATSSSWRVSTKSGTNDSPVEASCPSGQTLAGCSCHSWSNSCDGAKPISDRTCRAFNKDHGRGVYALARCMAVPESSNWTTVTGLKSATADHGASYAACPSGTTLTGCSCHSPGHSCEGAEFIGNECVAYNKYNGEGVHAYARCAKLY